VRSSGCFKTFMLWAAAHLLQRSSALFCKHEQSWVRGSYHASWQVREANPKEEIKMTLILKFFGAAAFGNVKSLSSFLRPREKQNSRVEVPTSGSLLTACPVPPIACDIHWRDMVAEAADEAEQLDGAGENAVETLPKR
jgi:hypothetical protein